MPPKQVLVLAMTRMLTGVCTAGLTMDPHPQSKLAWIRPVKDFGTLLLGDLRTADGQMIGCGDVVEFQVLKPRPNSPHVEDCVTELVRARPRILRRLEGERRARFLAERIDRSPAEVLGERPTRSLCLVRPDWVRASLELNPQSGQYKAHMDFALPGAPAERCVTVTDLKWRALGRCCLAAGDTQLELDGDVLWERLGTQEIFLALGLSRALGGGHWPLVIGVHLVPDYAAEIDWGNL